MDDQKAPGDRGKSAREDDDTKRRPPNRPSHNEQAICVDERGQAQPEDEQRARKNK
jgi:hypothetical protein